MRYTFSLLGSLLVLSFLAGAQAAPKSPAPPAASAAPQAPAAQAGYTGPDPCKLAVKGDSPVAQACREGGVAKAKGVMKGLVKRASEKGEKFSCDDCHKDPQDKSKLAPDANERFKKLLAAAAK